MNELVSKNCGCSAEGNAQARGGAAADRVVYRIENMDCPTEEALIRRRLAQLPEVLDLEFDLPRRTLAVLHTLSSSAALEGALADVGMNAVPFTPSVEPQTTVLQIDRMDCANEEGSIRRALAGMRGLVDLHFDLPQRSLTLRHAPESLPAIFAALKSIGFDAEVRDRTNDTSVSPQVSTPTVPSHGPVGPDAARVVYRIENMDCPTEEALIREKLGRLSGVSDLEFNLVLRRLTVRHTSASLDVVEEALAAIGMKAVRESPPAMGETTVLRIEKMDCPTEESLIRAKLTGMPGVSGLDFNLMQRTLTLTHAPGVLAAIITALKSLGFEVELRRAETVATERLTPPEPVRTNWWPLIVAGVSATAAEVVYWLNGGLHWSVIVGAD